MDMVAFRSAGTAARRGLFGAGCALATLIGIGVVIPSGAVRAADEAACNPVGEMHFICGAYNVEDWAPVPGAKWVFGADLAPKPPGELQLFDTATRTVRQIEPSQIAVKFDKQRFPDCPSPLDLDKMISHGLDLTPPKDGRATLYVVNHGTRDSVEAFDVDLTGADPKLTWVGCAVTPHTFWPDAVASLPDGGLVVTSLWDPTDPNRVQKLSKGEPVGALDYWHAGKGWTPVPGSEGMSGPNGVIVTPDGKTIYIGVWSGHAIMRITPGGAKPEVKSVPTGILTDNVRWSPDGKQIYAGGQATTVKADLACFGSSKVNCPEVPFMVYGMDPETMKLTVLVPKGSYGEMGAGTGAIRVGDTLWLSSFRADRIGIYPLK